jgi:hypothetical protein
MAENKNPSFLSLSPLVQENGVTIEFRGDHIHVQLGKGMKVGPEQRIELWARIAGISEEHNCRRVLVEGKAPEGVFQTTEVVDAGVKAGTVPKLWMAMCFDDFQPDELSELFEAVAGSRGVRVKHFSNPEQALRWLRNNAPG